MNVFENMAKQTAEKAVDKLLEDARDRVTSNLRDYLEGRRDEALIKLATGKVGFMDRVKNTIAVETLKKSGVLDQLIDDAVRQVDKQLQMLH